MTGGVIKVLKFLAIILASSQWLLAMCFALLAVRQHPTYPFILAANRDEYFHRPALPLHEWVDFPAIVGGRDVESAGSWLAINQQQARLALVTNYRAGIPQPAARSRGALVRDMLISHDLEVSLQQLAAEQQSYGGFNLITGQLPDRLWFFSNRNGQAAMPLTAGIHALSNASLDTPWPKVMRGQQRFAAILQQTGARLVEDLFTLLADTTPAADADLPDTGIGLEKERWLSSIFITGEQYGTRCSSVLLLDTAGQIHFHERTFAPQQVTLETCYIAANRSKAR